VNIEEVLVLLDGWLLEKKGQPLTSIEREILKRTLEGKTYDEMNIPGYSSGYIKMKIAPDIWKLLSELIETTVTKKNIKFVLEGLLKRSRSHPLQQFQPSEQKTEEDLEEVLSLVDWWFFQHKNQDLTNTEINLIVGVWEGKSYNEIAQENNYSESTVSHRVLILCKKLSELIGEKVTKANLRSVIGRVLKTRSRSNPLQQFDLESQKQLKPPSSIDWGESPDIYNFHGRTEELATLEQWIIKEQCRVIEIAGITGIGKTALVKKLATQIQDHFEFIVWKSRLYNSRRINNILTDRIELFSQQQEPNLLEEKTFFVSKVIEYLRSHRGLLILDNVESILQPGELAGYYRQGYENYGYLIKQVGETLHQSCLVITSREQLREIVLLQEGSSPVRSLTLQGLDKNAAMQLLSNRGLLDQEQWERLIDLYAANPLALKIVATMINDVFAGHVSNFLEMAAFKFINLDMLLDSLFERLSSLEKQIVSVLAMTSNAITIRELQEQLQPNVSAFQMLNALQSLIRRSLITRLMKEKEPFFTLHPLLKEYVKDRD
jgi:DNA-binding CsgD family transcriptional regulator